ncbi:MAG: hypothetical protein U0176_19110 [Bacteroidia bacterium]
MRNRYSILLFVLLLIAGGASHGQTPSKTPELAFKYKFQQSDGTNASTVAWDSDKQMYLTAIAGNRDFPLEAFGASGEPMGQGLTGIDMRGIWYNPKKNEFEANGFASWGWIRLPLKPDNTPDKPYTIVSGTRQPNEQAVGAYDEDKKQVIFLSAEGGVLLGYNRKNPKKQTRIPLEWKDVKAVDVNSTSVGFTGVKGAEFVLLDCKGKRLVFFSRSGRLAFKSDLPADAPINQTFCFAFANGHAFLFDRDARTWLAYKVF